MTSYMWNEIQNSSRPTRVFCLPTSLRSQLLPTFPSPIPCAQASCLYLNITNIHLPWDLKYSANIQMTSYPTFFSTLSIGSSLDRQIDRQPMSIALPHKFMFPSLACFPCKNLLLPNRLYVLVFTSLIGYLPFWNVNSRNSELFICFGLCYFPST